MNLEKFNKLARLKGEKEISKAAYIGFFLYEYLGQEDFSVEDISKKLMSLGYVPPNPGRLRKKIRESKSFINGFSRDRFRLSVNARSDLQIVLCESDETEKNSSGDSLFPEALMQETSRKYLVRIVQQINSSYEHNLFDACALMMRRLLEILLIHSFEAIEMGDDIKDADGRYIKLVSLINKAKSSPTMGLSPESKTIIDDVRELGNLSAHRIQYNCRRTDIGNIRMAYRALIEELLYKAALVSEQG